MVSTHPKTYKEYFEETYRFTATATVLDVFAAPEGSIPDHG